MAAKVDSSGLQDGYQIYHHSFFFTAQGDWAVVQQGMNDQNRKARRYHWLSDTVTDYVVEPHKAIASQAPGTAVLNLVAKESVPAQERRDRALARAAGPHPRPPRPAEAARPCRRATPSNCATSTPTTSAKIFLSTYERQPENFEVLLGLPGVGPKTIRALTLIAELVYDTPASRSDPALFSYAHGGKDGFPYPVDSETYDRNIEILRKAVGQAKLGQTERLDASAAAGEGRRRRRVGLANEPRGEHEPSAPGRPGARGRRHARRLHRGSARRVPRRGRGSSTT